MKYKYETFFRRFIAGLIDTWIPGAIPFLDFLKITENVWLMTLWTAISYSLFFLYSVYFHWRTGQTFGKMLLDVRVIDQSETRLLTVKQSIMRDSVYILMLIVGVSILISQILRLGGFPWESSVLDFLKWSGILWFFFRNLFYANKRKETIFSRLVSRKCGYS